MGLMYVHVCVNLTSELIEDKILSTHSCDYCFYELLTKGLPLRTEPCTMGESKYSNEYK